MATRKEYNLGENPGRETFLQQTEEIYKEILSGNHPDKFVITFTGKYRIATYRHRRSKRKEKFHCNITSHSDFIYGSNNKWNGSNNKWNRIIKYEIDESLTTEENNCNWINTYATKVKVYYSPRVIRDEIKLLQEALRKIIGKYVMVDITKNVDKSKDLIFTAKKNNQYQILIFADKVRFRGRINENFGTHSEWNGRDRGWGTTGESHGLPLMMADPEYFEKFEERLKEFLADMVRRRAKSVMENLGMKRFDCEITMPSYLNS
jgi:hypothetical protein